MKKQNQIVLGLRKTQPALELFSSHTQIMSRGPVTNNGALVLRTAGGKK